MARHPKMKRRLLMLLVLFLLAAIISICIINPDGLPIRHMGEVESLQSPLSVTGWSDAGLQIADGRTIPIPGIAHLPATSPALIEATKRGIEIAPDGQITCLVRTYHWCGNDPVTADIRRVNLSEMLTFLQVGQPTVPVLAPDLLDRTPGGSVEPEAGWNVSQYFDFRMWQEIKNNPALMRSHPTTAPEHN
jgi:hypothetical protein